MFLPDLAFDYVSVRSYDRDGRLRVRVANISKAVVNPYLGSEVPNWQGLGLDPQRVYKFYRDPAELGAAAATFNNLPLLARHVPVNADDHKPDDIVGATGSDARLDAPYLTNSLIVWASSAIRTIENGTKCQLSAAYRYEPDMRPGFAAGQAYDGVMRGLHGNHVALVPEGRAGADVVVGDGRMSVSNEGLHDRFPELRRIRICA